METAIAVYKEFARGVFGSPPLAATNTYDPDILEQHLKTIITSSSLDLNVNSPLEDDHQGACPTFVIATYIRAANAAVRMRTYSTTTQDPFPATIWEVARATTATPTIFHPMIMDDVQYGDGGTGWNNPAEEALAEAHNKWPGRKIACLISIGTGLQGALQFGGAGDLTYSSGSAFKAELARFSYDCLIN